MASSDAKPASQDKPATESKPDEQHKPTTTLGEDDEFEDFPVDGMSLLPATFLSQLTGYSFADWPEEETEAAETSGTTQHLWEESWDDDDTSDDFSSQLKSVLSRKLHISVEPRSNKLAGRN
jgi:26 proteasome complex subunit DSS1